MRIVHVVESIEQSAGSVSIGLTGLARALRGLGIESELSQSVDPASDAISKADLIHVFGWHYPSALAAARAARPFNKPLILAPLGALTPGSYELPGLLTRIGRFFSERPLRRAARIVTAIHEREVLLLRQAGESRGLRVLPLGIDFNEYDSLDEKIGAPSARNLLVLGPIDPAAGSVLLLKAMAELGPLADGWIVTLAGPDPRNLRGQLEAAVRRKGGEARVSFCDAPTPEDQKKLLMQATVLADVSLRVSPGVSIMQALAAGVPVVATELAAPLKADVGLSVCGPRRDEVREALRTLIGTELGKLREAGRLARERLKPILDWTVLAPRYLEMYEECLRG